MTDPKPRSNRAIEIEALRRMPGEQRLLKAFELTKWTRALTRQGQQPQTETVRSRD